MPAAAGCSTSLSADPVSHTRVHTVRCCTVAGVSVCVRVALIRRLPLDSVPKHFEFRGSLAPGTVHSISAVWYCMQVRHLPSHQRGGAYGFKLFTCGVGL